MDCAIDQHLLEGYLDGELAFERTLEVEAHLASCRTCDSEVQSWKDVRGTLQRSDLYHRAPTHLEEKIRRLVPQENRGERLPWFRRWIWAGGGAAFATAALLIAFMLSRPPAPSAEQEIVSSHIRSLMANHLMDVISTDQHTVKPWFDGKLDFAPPVVDLASAGFPLVGGRLDYANGRPVAALVYQRQKHLINVFIWPIESSSAKLPGIQTIQGYNLVFWQRDGMYFCAASDLNVAELGEFVQLLER